MNNKRKSPIWITPKEDFVELVKSKEYIKDILNFYGLNNGSNYKTLRKRIFEEGLEEEYERLKRNSDKKKTENAISFIKKDIEYYLVEDSPIINNNHLKIRLIKEKMIEEKCFECGLENEWNGRYLSLQLDHINGKNKDNRLENLRLLCPNCHTQTKTFAGKRFRKTNNCEACGKLIGRRSKRCSSCSIRKSGIREKARKVKNRPSKEELKKLIDNNSWCAIGRMYGVSDNAIRKWAKSYELM